MSVSYASRGHNSVFFSSTGSVPRPNGTAEGDMIFLSASASHGVSAWPAGFTEIIVQASGGVTQSVAWKLAGASEPTSYSVTFAGSALGNIEALRYVSSLAGTIRLVASDTVTASAASIVAPSVTSDTNNSLLIAIVASTNTANHSYPASMTRRYIYSLIAIASAGDESIVGIGATGTRTIGFSGSVNGAAVSILLADESAAPPEEDQTQEEKAEFDWGLGDSFTDETEYLVTASGVHRIAPPEDSIASSRGIISQATIVLSNKDGRFSPLNADSPIYANIAGGSAYQTPVKISVSMDGGTNYYRVFTGVAKIPVESVATPTQHPIVTVDCRGMEEKWLYSRASTTRANFATYHDEGRTEAELIQVWLDAVGVGSANYNIDRGWYTIPWGWLDDESPIEDAWQLAAAAGGRFRADVGGTLIYERMDKWLYGRSSSSQYTFNEDDYQGLEVWYNDQELYNSVTVEVAARQVDPTQIVWEPDEQVIVPAGGTVIIDARFQQPIYTFGSVNYAAVTTGNVSLADDVTVTSVIYAQRATITVVNANASIGAILKKFYITGSPVVSTRGAESNASSSDSFWNGRGSRNRALRGNPYIQTINQADALSDFLQDRYETPTLFFRIRNAPGRPELELGDRITIDNTPTFQVSQACYITAISWRLSDQGFYQDIEAVKAADVFPNAASYFILDSDTLGTPTPTAKVFY